MTRNGVLISLAVLLSAAELGGCRSSLTRAHALELLTLEAKKNSADMHFVAGRVFLQVGIDGDCEGKDYDSVQRDATTAALVRVRYAQVEPIKPHLWRIGLTQLGEKAIDGEKYGHTTKGPCDHWQVTIPLVRFDHFDVTGVVNEGSYATADVQATFLLTPVAVALRPIVDDVQYQTDVSTYGKGLADTFRDEAISSGKSILGSEAYYASPLGKGSMGYTKTDKVKFAKYDDGWRVVVPDSK
jgi:hypothetical protein